MTIESEYWKDFFAHLHEQHELNEAHRVGMSNERVTAQEYALILESCGPVAGRSCLDVGCGLGQVARLLHSLGAEAEGVDYVTSTIDELRRKYGGIFWHEEDITAPSRELLSRTFDTIVVCEVLQHLDAAKVIPALWEILDAGGRLVGLVPNAECPIVQRTRDRFGGRYVGLTRIGLREIADGLAGLRSAQARGLSFQSDQTALPYVAGSWSDLRRDQVMDAMPPNRLQFIFIKRIASDN